MCPTIVLSSDVGKHRRQKNFDGCRSNDIDVKIRYNLSAFFVTPALPAPSGVVASARLCCLSRVPPAVCPSLESATTVVRYACPSSSFRCSHKRPSLYLCCLSRVPPAVCPSLLESTTTVWTSFLQSLSTYVHTPTPHSCLLYTSPSPRDRQKSRMPSSA